MAIRMKWRMNSRVSNWILLICKKQINTRVKVLRNMSGLIDYLWQGKLRGQVFYFKTFLSYLIICPPFWWPGIKIANNKRFFWVIDFIVRFNLFKKLPNSSADWLGDLSSDTIVQSLLPIFRSKQMHSFTLS